MNLRIADTFTTSLAKLTNDEQKQVKITVYDLQADPSGASGGGGGLQMHRVDRARDKNFWSVRVSRDLRLIVHRQDAGALLCYVDHHDDAYDWAQRRKLETHPRTGAAQIVEVLERTQEVVVPRYVEGTEASAVAAARGPGGESAGVPLFADRPEEELLGYGVPADRTATSALRRSRPSRNFFGTTLPCLFTCFPMVRR